MKSGETLCKHLKQPFECEICFPRPVKVKEAIAQARGNDDLWDQLDAALAEVSPIARPEGSFTRKEFQTRRNLSDSYSSKLLSRLVDEGKLTRHGNGCNTYYVLVRP